MDKAPYGDVTYADPGYQKDGQKRYPIDTAAHVRAAWSYINQADNRTAYSAEQLAGIEGRIKAAAKRFGIEIADSGKSETLMITIGPAVKALGNGQVSGHLCRNGSEATKDAEGEWFTAETDFDTEFPARTSIRWHHGMDPAIGRRRLGYGVMDRDELGIRIDARLDLSDPAQKAIYRKVERGEVGWSSGSLSHLTDPPRENPGGPIRHWPLGHDASLTPIPSDRRNLAVAVKSVPLPPLESLLDDGERPSLNERIERLTDTAEVLNADLRTHAVKTGAKISGARRERIRRLRDELSQILDETEPRDAAAVALPPVMGEGDEEGTQGVLPDLHDLYMAATRQYSEAVAMPMGG